MSRNRIICALLIIPLYLFAQDIDEAIRLFNASQFDHARRIFAEVIKNENNPRIAEAFYYLGRLSIVPDSALAYYNRVIRDYPQSRYADIAYLELAKINIAHENYRNALVALSELWRRYPDTNLKDEIMFWLGVSYMSSGKEEEGITTLKNLRKAYPKSLWSERALTILPQQERPEVPKEYYTLQVGSYRNKDNAETYAQEISEQGFTCQVVEALVKGNTYYRVWAGKFPSIEQAKTFSLKLDSLGIKGNVVRGY